MFRCRYLLLAFMGFFSSLQAQEAGQKTQSTNLYVGYRSPFTVQSTVEVKLKDGHFIGFNANYSFRVTDSRDHNGLRYAFTRSFNRGGPGIGIFYRSKMRTQLGAVNFNFIKVGLEYNKLKSGNFRQDDGKFSGSNTSDYYEFKDEYNNISFLVSIVKLSDSRTFGCFIEGGVHFRYIDRQYSIEGAYNDRDSEYAKSDRREEFTVPGASVRVGVFVRLINNKYVEKVTPIPFH